MLIGVKNSIGKRVIEMNTYFGNSFVETSLLAPSIRGVMVDYSRKGVSIVMNHAVDRGLMRKQDGSIHRPVALQISCLSE